MAHFMPRAVLELFAPRPPLEYKPSLVPQTSKADYGGVSSYASYFKDASELAPVEESRTPAQVRADKKQRKQDRAQKRMHHKLKQWKPSENDAATGDAYKTLFVGRLAFDVTEEMLKDEMERWGPVKSVRVVVHKSGAKQGQSSGYAFVEFESETDLKEAYRRADGKKINGKRVVVDVERGRTVKNWQPRKFAGGIGKIRNGNPTESETYSGREVVKASGVAPRQSRPANDRRRGGIDSSRRDDRPRDDRRDDRRGDRREDQSGARDRDRSRDYRGDRDRADRGVNDYRSSRSSRDSGSSHRSSRSSRDDRDSGHRSSAGGGAGGARPPRYESRR